MGESGPFVSFCFDDFPTTAYTVGGSILKTVGGKGTYYAAMGLMNTHNHLGNHFRRGDLERLLADGHELASHTFRHLSCRAVPFGVFEQDVKKGNDCVRRIAGTDSVNFSYPFGHVTVAAKNLMDEQVHSARGIYAGLNTRSVDLNLLRANAVYGDMDGFQRFESLFATTRRQKGWLILYTHDVRSTPSQFGCTPALLERVVGAASEMGLEILSVRDVLCRILTGTTVAKPPRA